MDAHPCLPGLSVGSFWRSKKQQKQFFPGTKSGLLHFKTESEKAEFGHITSFVVLAVVGVFLTFRGSISLGAWIFFWNILGNLYPVVLQRYHRVRIQPLLTRL